MKEFMDLIHEAATCYLNARKFGLVSKATSSQSIELYKSQSLQWKSASNG